MWEIGTSRVEIDTFFKGVGMLGYGRDWNKIEGQLTPLYVRAWFLKSTVNEGFVFYANAEICFITDHLKAAVLKALKAKLPELECKDEQVILAAQHTHSGPGGYSHYPMYNFPVPGFKPAVFDALVYAIVKALKQAYERKRKANLKWGHGLFEPEIEVGYNRSLRAYNKNEEATPLTLFQTHLAIERRMDMIKAEDEQGQAIGQINWFGVHTTSLGNRINQLCYDNKGFAGEGWEQDWNGFNAIFAQQLAADVSPNFHGKGKSWKKGPFESDIENAKFNGKLQLDKAKEIWNLTHDSVVGGIDSVIMYVDFSNVKVAAEFSNGFEEAETDAACHGTAFFKGTPVDGKGMAPGVSEFAVFCSIFIKWGEKAIRPLKSETYRKEINKKYRVQAPKHIVYEMGRGKLFGTRNIKHFFIPGFFDGGIKEMKHQHRIGALTETPWCPHVTPIQLVQIGNIVLAGFPGEITTVGGQRLRAMLMEVLAPKGVDYVIISSYSNSYMGYVTTFEEYHAQCYEGGHTVYGKWTHGAFMTKFKELALEFLKPSHQRAIQSTGKPMLFSEKELALRSYPV